MKQNAEVIFLNGDFSYSEDEHETRQWFSKLFANYNGRIFGSLGNHDLGLSDLYKELFNQGQWTYSIDIGKVHFELTHFPSYLGRSRILYFYPLITTIVMFFIYGPK